ncbi:spore coat protein CotJB [Anaerocolumna sedimenticola]|nr:spore coat protein CotJB [Anaerocolumna sedimenticola]
MNQDKCDAMKNVQAVCFALDDLRLFLDTHPYEKEAISNYEQYKNQRKQILQEYEQNFGPILAYNVKQENQWTWVESPWPWEGEL